VILLSLDIAAFWYQKPDVILAFNSPVVFGVTHPHDTGITARINDP
jgi:hypothetical protein